jgi:hypothetical protein
VFVVFARFWPDSARTRIPRAKIAAIQKINLAALDVFIVLVFFYASLRRILFRIAGEAQRFGASDIARAPANRQAESSSESGKTH